MLRAVVALLFAAMAQNPQIRRPFKSDPPVMCADCPAWNADREPFRVFGNTYYVGTEHLSSILITSDHGHILLDGGLPQSAELIDRHIRRLRFRTEDVKLIVNSRAQFDRAGGIHALQHASGATVAASAADARALKQGSDEFPGVSKVREVKDGETLHVGTLSVTAHSTPGPTPVNTTWTWKSCEESRCRDFAYSNGRVEPLDAQPAKE
jgi:metallo-beta-lactamase class B